MLCRTRRNTLLILGIHPLNITQTRAINRRISNRPSIHPTSPIRMVNGGTQGSTRARNTCTNSLTTYHTCLNGHSCLPNLISSSSKNRAIPQTSSCVPPASPSPKLGLRRLNLNHNPPLFPHLHNRPQNQTHRSNRPRHKILVSNRSVSHIIPTHLLRGRNG